MTTHRNIKLFTWFNFFLEFKPYAPIVILYFKEVTGSFALGLSIFSIMTIATSLLEVPTGIFSDMIGRKKTIMFGALVSFLGVVSWAIGESYLSLAIGAAFLGLGEAFFSGNNEALLHDSLKESGRERVSFRNFLEKQALCFRWDLEFLHFWAAISPCGLCKQF